MIRPYSADNPEGQCCVKTLCQSGSSEERMISIKRYLDSDSPGPVVEADAIPQDPFAVALDVYGSFLLEMGHCSLDACPGLGDALQQTLARLKGELCPGMRTDQLAA